MARAARIVDRNQIVQDVRQFVAAYDGAAQAIMKAAIAHDGTVCQFWPPDISADDPIVMTGDTELSYDIKAPTDGEPRAQCNYDAQSGNLILSSPDGDVSVPVLSPVPRGVGQYLYRFDTLSGPIVTVDTEGAWVDVFSEGNLAVFEYYLPNTTSLPGQVLGQATFSIAEDDGLGAPLGGTQVSKTINFIAERTGNNLSLGQNEWTLEDTKINEVARAKVETENDGWLRGYEGGIQVLAERYALNWNNQFLVRMVEVSGSIAGSAKGVFLNTATKRTWEVAAGPGTSNSAEGDLTVTDGVNFITKRINFIATSTEEGATSDLSDEWTAYLQINDEETTYSGQPAEAGGRIIIYPTGEFHAHTYHPPSQLPNNIPGYPVDWNASAPTVPDPENFEARVTVISGDPPTDAGLVGIWLNLSSQREWILDTFALASQPFATVVDDRDGTWLVEIREVGRPETVKSKTVRIIVLAISNGTGISIP